MQYMYTSFLVPNNCSRVACSYRFFLHSQLFVNILFRAVIHTQFWCFCLCPWLKRTKRLPPTFLSQERKPSFANCCSSILYRCMISTTFLFTRNLCAVFWRKSVYHACLSKFQNSKWLFHSKQFNSLFANKRVPIQVSHFSSCRCCSVSFYFRITQFE